MTLAEILKDSSYKLTQFNLVEVQNIEKQIIIKTDKNDNAIPYFNCLVRHKEIRLNPEEVIRQLYLQVLINDFDYPVKRMEVEYAVLFGR